MAKTTTTTTTAGSDDERHARPFADWMLEQRNGVLHAELTDALQELVESVNEYGKPGELVLKVKVKPATKNAHGALAVADAVTVKKPMGDRAEALFFVDDNNNLTRENPAQPRLPLREVGKDAPEDSDADAEEA